MTPVPMYTNLPAAAVSVRQFLVLLQVLAQLKVCETLDCAIGEYMVCRNVVDDDLAALEHLVKEEP